jgi:hypothetical protein
MSITYPAGVSNVGSTDSARFLANGWPASWIEEDPDAAATSPEAVFKAASLYVEAGLSVIPIDAEEPTKSPDPRRIRSWKIYQIRKPRKDELRSWLDCGGSFGLAVVGGRVSGREHGCGLEIVDFDSFEFAAPWLERVEERMPGLTAKLVMVNSPRPGFHVYYRCAAFGECQKLACGPAMDIIGEIIRDPAGHPKKATWIELKAEGGYCLVPPSPRRCHPRNKLYRLRDGSPDLTCVPVISCEERTIILEEARRFNQWTEDEPKRDFTEKTTKPTDGNRPGDDFERRASWADILEPHGWVLVRQRGPIEDWRRPGKSDGISGTVNYADTGLFYAFSSNAYPFEEKRGYSKFHAYAALNHGGDFVKAAQALKNEGFGPKSLAAGKRVTTTVLKLGVENGER